MKLPPHERRRRRIDDVKRRAASPTADYPRCRIIGCPEQTRGFAGRGLSQLYCKKHEEHRQRHGSYLKRSYTGPKLAPYRRAAEKWIKANKSLPRLAIAVERVRTLMENAGAREEAFRLRGLPPKERARIAWARLREAGADPARILAVWLAVELIERDDLQPEAKAEFRRVQVAKVLHRMSSGTHRRWETPTASGQTVVQELHAYPHSRGRVLRHIGQSLEAAAELVIEHHLDSLIDFAKNARARERPKFRSR